MKRQKTTFINRFFSLILVGVMCSTMMATLPSVEVEAVEYIELTNVPSSNQGENNHSENPEVGRTFVNDHTYVAALFGTAAWASNNAYSFSNGSSLDYRAAFNGETSGNNFFDGEAGGHCGVEFHEAQYVTRIGYQARQSPERLDGAVLEGSNDGVNYESLYILDGSNTSNMVYRTIADGLKADLPYKYFRVMGGSALNGALNPIELKFYTCDRNGDGTGIIEELSMPTVIYGSISLPTSLLGCQITWTSKTPEIIDNAGNLVLSSEVQRPVAATLTATLEWNTTQKYTRDFNITIAEPVAFGDSDIVKDMDLISELNFNDDPVDGSFTGVGAKANVNGVQSYGMNTDGTRSARLSSGFWLDVTKEDGSPLLAGLSEFTVSYDVNSTAAAGSSQAWTFFASRTVRSPKDNWESYLGVVEKMDSIEVQRFHNSGTKPSFVNNFPAPAGWRHVDVVFTKDSTKIYINGEHKTTQTSEKPIEQILSKAGGFLYLGKSTWGEYFTGEIDNFKIWKPADLDDAAKVAKAKEALTLPYGVDENQVYGNITLPSTGLNGTTISWATDSPDVVDVRQYDIENYDPRPAGTVTRPNADKVVNMTATLSFGAVSETKTFSFTVKRAPDALDDTEAYLFVYFTGGEGSATDEQVYFSTSLDGAKWTDLSTSGNPILSSTSGDQGVRDPYIIRSPEGDKFYMIGTDLSIYRRGGWGSAGWQSSSTKMVIWESADLVNWSEARIVDVAGGIQDAGMLWAPEVIYDDITGDYFVFWATLTSAVSTQGNGPFIFYARTRDFHTFTKPALWIGSQNIIDTTAIKDVDGNWYRSTKDEGTSKNIILEKSTSTVTVNGETYSSLLGDWEYLSRLDSIFTPWSYGAVEGPELFLYNQKDWKNDLPTYGLYVDRYGAGAGYQPFRTTDLDATEKGSNWDVPTVNLGSVKKRHGGIMAITMDEYEALMEAHKGEDDEEDEDDEEFILPSEMQLVANFDFNELPDGGNADISDVSDNAVAKVNGTISRSTDYPASDTSGYSANISNDFWLDIVNKDGSALLKSKDGVVYDEVIISYDSKPNNNIENLGWILYADRDKSQNAYPNEHYLGVIDKVSGISVERFNNNGSRPGNDLAGPSSTNWKHVDLYVKRGRTLLYVDGQLQDAKDSAFKLSDILTSTGGFFQVGKSNWGGSGEFYRGLIDNLKIYALETEPEQLLTGVQSMTPSLDPVQDLESVNMVIHSKLDAKNKTAKIYISRSNNPAKGDLTAIPLDFTMPSNTEVVNPLATYDLSSPVDVTFSFNGGQMTETWTISAELSNNPVLPGRYADPDILMYNGKYYMYPTTDGFPGWGGYQFKVFSSEDLIDWVDEGVIVDLRADISYKNSKGVDVAIVPWSDGNAWAPAIEEKNGKFYFYFCGNDVSTSGNHKAIGVAVADSPTGPFRLPSTATDRPLLQRSECNSEGISMGQVIDPQIYTEEETGKSYMLFGNGNAAIVELGSNMTSWVSGTMKNYVGATDFREAITVNKIDGVYHFTWSCDDTGNENYHVKYGISDNLYGPILNKGVLLQKDNANDIKGSAHHDILYHEERDEYYIVYHRFWTPLGQYTTGGAGNHRETCIDKLEYKDGIFQVVKPTLAGITEPVPATLVESPVPALYGHSLTLDGTIGVNWYVSLPDAYQNVDTKMVFTYNGKQKVVPFDEEAKQITDEGDTVYRFTYSVPAKEMTQEIKAQLVDAADEPLVDEDIYTVKTYADLMLEGESFTSEAKGFAKALLNYGGYAQMYFDFHTEDAANKGIEDLPEITETDLEQYGVSYGTEYGTREAVWYGSSLILESQTTLRHYVTISNEEVAEQAYMEYDGERVEFIRYQDSSLYYADINISVLNLKRKYEARIYKEGGVAISNTKEYGAYTYAYNMLRNPQKDGLKDLMKAMYGYAEAAENYLQ